MKIYIIHDYDRAIKRLEHSFPINANHIFSPLSINAHSRFAASSSYGKRAEFTGAFLAMFNLQIGMAMYQTSYYTPMKCVIAPSNTRYRILQTVSHGEITSELTAHFFD